MIDYLLSEDTKFYSTLCRKFLFLSLLVILASEAGRYYGSKVGGQVTLFPTATTDTHTSSRMTPDNINLLSYYHIIFLPNPGETFGNKICEVHLLSVAAG